MSIAEMVRRNCLQAALTGLQEWHIFAGFSIHEYCKGNTKELLTAAVSVFTYNLQCSWHKDYDTRVLFSNETNETYFSKFQLLFMVMK